MSNVSLIIFLSLTGLAAVSSDRVVVVDVDLLTAVVVGER